MAQVGDLVVALASEDNIEHEIAGKVGKIVGEGRGCSGDLYDVEFDCSSGMRNKEFVLTDEEFLKIEDQDFDRDDAPDAY